MRARTMVLAGIGAAAIAYVFDPREGRARRNHLLATIQRLPGDGAVQVEGPVPVPQNVAPTHSAEPEPPPDHREPTAGATPGRSDARPVSVARPNATVDDAAIVQNVRTRLEERRDLGTDDLVVDVVNGVAYLSGDLHDRQTFGEVVDLTRDVPGVRRVQSLLHLPHSETFTRTIAGRRAGDEPR
jgi:hypothetical protein